MANTAETLKNKSQGFKEGFVNLVNLMIETNKEIEAQEKANEAAIAQAEANIAHLHRDNDELAALKADNEKFIAEMQRVILGA